jgi:quercetin dioxygenase-like cupin family protein
MEFTHSGALEESFRDRRKGSMLVRAEDADFFDLPERNSKEWIYSHKLPAKTLGFHVAEFAPNTHGGTHRHLCEAIIYIIEGAGYSLIDGQERVEWKAGDALFIPPMCWHSHHTGDTTVRVIGMWNIPLMEALGLYFIEEAADTGHPDAQRFVRDTLLPVES